MHSRNQRRKIFRICAGQRRLQRTRRQKQVRKNAAVCKGRRRLYRVTGRSRTGLISEYQGAGDFRAAKEFLATAPRLSTKPAGKSSLSNSAVATSCSNNFLTRLSSTRFCSVIGSPCRSIANTFLISSYAEAMTG